MNFFERMLRKPHAIIAITLVTVLAGIIAYITLPMNLFPDTNRPVVAVITQWPGAAANDVATDVTHPIEVRMKAIDGVRRVYSTSRDQVSSVQIEFHYGNNIDEAATKVTTELPRVRSLLPQGIKEPLIFKITDAARPLEVLAVTSAKGYDLSLPQIRRLAENQLRDALLNIPGVAEAEVFGSQERQVAVDLDRNKLEAYQLTVGQVALALANSNISMPSGLIYQHGNRYILNTQVLAKGPEDIGQILVPLPKGNFVRVSDLGDVKWGIADITSIYRGNSKPAIAISILRGEEGHAREIIAEITKDLPQIQKQFPMLHIEEADTQGRLIDLTVDNMLGALRDAVIMTIIVILLFLGDTRAAFITALSLPFTYLLTFAVLNMFGYEFDMVTLTAIIIAVGLLADDAIVVIENIERTIRVTGDSSVVTAAKGTQEIFLAAASGTISVIVVLIPIMFIGGYVQTVLRPLAVTLAVALMASLIVSVTIIPLLVPYLLRPGRRDPLYVVLHPFEVHVLDPLKRFYARVVSWGLEHRALVLSSFGVLFIISLALMNVVGRELMPLMDSGTFIVNYEAQPDMDTPGVEKIATQIEKAVKSSLKPGWLLSMSGVDGAEAGVKSFGADRVLQHGQLTVNIIDRFHRNETMYQIEDSVRNKIRRIPGLISSNVTEYGATPLSSLRGTVDMMITGPDPSVLDQLADSVLYRLRNVRGLTGTERTWQGKSKRINLQINEEKARLYGLTPQEIAGQVAQVVGGTSGGRLRVTGEIPIPVWVRFQPNQRSNPEDIAAIPIRTRDGSLVPLSSFAKPEVVFEPTAETHEALLPTVDVLGYRTNISITQLHTNIEAALKGFNLPRGYTMSDHGEIMQLNESFAALLKSFVIGVALLYLMLVIVFKSFRDPVAIMASLPLALIGASWAMLIADKHGCLPSFMGLILLMGIIVKNGILLVDFAKVAMEQGKSPREAILEAVQLRTRPILMTAGAAAVGMIPIALEWAVGIERLSPLAVVAIGGLITGTFLTLLAVPVFHLMLEQSHRNRLAKRLAKHGN
jgi:multidrug efflux pump subunit AcrB